MNKRKERFYVERAAEMLDVSWTVGEDREIPDFIVTEGDRQFGLDSPLIKSAPSDSLVP